MDHTIEPPTSGWVVHLEVGDTLEVRLPFRGDQAWSVTLRPYGLLAVTDGAKPPSRGTFRFRAEFGVGGLLRLEKPGRIVDVCVTVAPEEPPPAPPAPSAPEREPVPVPAVIRGVRAASQSR